MNMSQVIALDDLDLLPAFARCGTCGKLWDTGDTPMVVIDQYGEDVNLAEFVGQPLSHARNILLQRGEQGGVFYDLSPFVLHLNEEMDDTVDWTYPVQTGDKGLALVISYFHPECREDVFTE